MSPQISDSHLVFWRDWAFWSALALGPLSWLILSSTGMPPGKATVDWQALMLAALVYPILEEYVFRGGLQAALYRRLSMRRAWLGISMANVITSIIFAALHLFNQSPVWAALIFFPSLVFGWMRDRYGKIHASTLLHISYNTGFVVLFM